MDATSLQSLAAFVLTGTALVAEFGDYITTAEDLAIGGKELNPVARYLQAKIGQAATAFLGGAMTIGTVGLFAWAGYPALGAVFAAVITGIETWMTIRNYRLTHPKTKTAVVPKTLVK